MSTYTLTAANPVSPAFEIDGDMYICAKGEGTIKIERKIGSSFEVLTTETGVAMEFIGSGILFNNKVSTSKGIQHRFSSETTGEITVDLVKGRR